MASRVGLNGRDRLVGHSPKRLGLLLTVVGAFAVLLLFFGPALGGEILYSGDAARVYLPERTTLARALSEGTLPWWTADVGAGYPLLAEGQVATFYPISLLLTLWPADVSLNLYVFVHLALAAAGWVFFARISGRSWAAAALGALVYSLGGFNIAHLSHLPVLATAAWVPWQFGLTCRILRAERMAWLDVAALAVVTGLQWLAGHVQVALLGALPLVAYALWLRWPRREAVTHPWRRRAWWALALAVGLVLASPQLLPSIELVALSQRAGGLDSEFFTSFSFFPLLTATFVVPFLRGNPYPDGSVELMCYVGLLPLGLAAWALWRERRCERWFWMILALVGLLLAFGRWNPIYDYLRHVPGLNLFRVPSRYLYWTSLSLAVLGGMGLDALAAHTPERLRRAGWVLLGVIAVGLGVTLGVGVIGRDLDGLVAAWRWLPLTLGAMTLAVLAAARYVPARIWLAAALVVLVADLYAYGAVLSGTYNVTTPREVVLQEPELLDFLQQDDGLHRIYTKEEIMPTLSVQRESLFPNMGLQHGLDSANLYFPLVPDNYRRYTEDLTASRLDRLNVRYYLIPQLLPVDEESELYDVYNPMASVPYGEWLPISPRDVVEVEVESYLSHSVDLPDGTLAAEIVLRDAEGREEVFPLRVGMETAEWAYNRDDVREQIAHALPEIAYTFPARSGFPERDHDGHVYQASLRLETPMRVQKVLVRPSMPEAFVRIEGVKLIGAEGESDWLAHLVGLGRHRIVYRSADVLVYRNEDTLPRSYVLPAAAVSLSGGDLWLPEGPLQDRVGAVRVLAYEAMRVQLQATVDEESYLILADLDYPGWEAEVDGRPAEILSAEGVFRAVRLEQGTHEVVFHYHPTMLRGLVALRRILHE
ncbi:MAG: YfhO family protein [Anaerolineae bacterium]